MRIGLYDPYLETTGGGEKYLLTILELACRTPKTETWLFSPSKPAPTAWRRLNIHVKKSQFHWGKATNDSIPAISKSFDVFVVMHNGLPPACHAKRSIAHIQFPFESLPFMRKRDYTHPVQSFTVRRKAINALRTYDSFIVNSAFTKRNLVRRLAIPRQKVTVVPPPVDVPKKGRTEKSQIILAVGRFITHGHHKKQDMMIQAFRRLFEEIDDKKWTFHIVGGATSDPETKKYIAQLRRDARGFPIEFHVNASYGEVADLYRRASLFWHATGAGENAKKFPERLEHFGITTVEAMMNGAVPIVINLGGQPEIVTSGKNGYLWKTQNELVNQTKELISNPKKRSKMGKAARTASKRFSKEEFFRKISDELFS